MIQFADLTAELQQLVRNNCRAAFAFRLARVEKWKLRKFLEFLSVEMAKQAIGVSELHQSLVLKGPPPNVVVMDEQGIRRLQLEYCGPKFDDL